MKKIISASFLAALALIMLLPVARQVNAASVNHSVLRQGGVPMPGGGSGHFTLRQGGVPMPGGGSGHFTLRQGGVPMPGGGSGH
jgi:hypothetical protein